MVVDAKSGKYVVVAVFQDSPAHNAGIRPGDTVVAVDGVSPAGLPMNDVLKKVRGPVGSVIHLTLHEKNTGAERSLKLRRRLIRVAPVRYGIVTPGIGYLRIVNFQQNTLKQTEAALTRMLQSPEGLKGLILDLRDNPGGLFGEAVQIADIFVTQGVITRVTGRHPKFRQTVSAKPRSKCPEIPIVILINSGTASAAEILAGALQGREKVAVMGEPSFGKASVQAVFPLGNAGVRITVAAYLTAAGRDIDGVGLEPDIKLKDDHPDPSLMYDPDAFHSDPWIREAVQVLTGHGDVQ
jgi:carboxyl-terminal processing protease